MPPQAGLDDSSAPPIWMLDPSILGGEGEESDMGDPRKRLLQMMGMKAAAQLSGGGEGETGGGGGGGNVAGPPATGAPAPNPTRSGTPGGLDTINMPPPVGMLEKAQATGDTSDLEGIVPRNFNAETGMPTEFPATAAKEGAAARLQRAQGFNQPQGLKRDLLRGGLQLAPLLLGLGGGGAGSAGAATGTLAAQQLLYNRGLTERQDAEKMYEFEASREMEQANQAMRERIAMSQIEANKAYRLLMASIANRRANTQETNSELNGRKAGYGVDFDGQGVGTIRNLNPDELSAVQQAKLGVTKAQQDLDAARTKAIPEQIAIAEKRLGIQQQLLQKSLAELGLRQWGLEMQRESLDFRETGPTTTSRNRAQQARTLPDHIKNFQAEVDQAMQRGLIGPMQGRVVSDFLAGRVGSTGDPETDKFLGQMQADAKFLTGAALLTHFNGRGITLYGSFENMLAAKHSGAYLTGDLSSFADWMGTYGGMDQWTPLGGRAAEPQLNGGQGNSRTGNRKPPSGGGGGNIPPKGATIRDYSKLRGANATANTPR